MHPHGRRRIGWRERVAPVGVEDRVEDLVDLLAVLGERLAKQTLLHGAQLLEGAVATAVLYHRARFQPVHAERLEREIEHELRALLEHARAPEVGVDREAP